MGFGAEVITRRQNKIAKLFYEKAAFSESQSLSENMVLGSKEVNLRTLSLLLKEGVVIKSDKGYYIDQQKWKRFRHSFKRFFKIFSFIYTTTWQFVFILIFLVFLKRFCMITRRMKRLKLCIPLPNFFLPAGGRFYRSNIFFLNKR